MHSANSPLEKGVKGIDSLLNSPFEGGRGCDSKCWTIDEKYTLFHIPIPTKRGNSDI